jgi:multidrug efflux pump subunit AcrA (membrane-fusion protein)
VKAYQAAVTASVGAVSTAAAQVSSARAVVAASAADVASAQDNLKRYAVLQGFNQITAPFNGIITARNVDQGSLISAGGSSNNPSVGSDQAGASNTGSAASGSGSTGSGGGSSGSLFSIAQLDLMRVYVNMPQDDAAYIHPGVAAQVVITSMPNHVFAGFVTRNAGALDPSSRTLVTEVDLPNPGHLLRPGMFGQVTLRIPTNNQGFFVPGTSVVTNLNNTQLVEVTSQNKIHFLPVTLGRDFGAVTQILTGLNGNEQIIVTPTDGMMEGQKVKIVPGQPTTSMTGSGGGGGSKPS